jgi:PIN domain nuclease of toxin-antitoxin system
MRLLLDTHAWLWFVLGGDDALDAYGVKRLW